MLATVVILLFWAPAILGNLSKNQNGPKAIATACKSIRSKPILIL